MHIHRTHSIKPMSPPSHLSTQHTACRLWLMLPAFNQDSWCSCLETSDVHSEFGLSVLLLSSQDKMGSLNSLFWWTQWGLRQCHVLEPSRSAHVLSLCWHGSSVIVCAIVHIIIKLLLKMLHYLAEVFVFPMHLRAPAIYQSPSILSSLVIFVTLLACCLFI